MLLKPAGAELAAWRAAVAAAIEAKKHPERLFVAPVAAPVVPAATAPSPAPYVRRVHASEALRADAVAPKATPTAHFDGVGARSSVNDARVRTERRLSRVARVGARFATFSRRVSGERASCGAAGRPRRAGARGAQFGVNFYASRRERERERDRARHVEGARLESWERGRERVGGLGFSIPKVSLSLSLSLEPNSRVAVMAHLSRDASLSLSLSLARRADESSRGTLSLTLSCEKSGGARGGGNQGPLEAVGFQELARSAQRLNSQYRSRILRVVLESGRD